MIMKMAHVLLATLDISDLSAVHSVIRHVLLPGVFRCLGSVLSVVTGGSCPVNCFRRVCDQIRGECTVGCTLSFYGPLCDQECPGCLEGACDTPGVCVDGCVDGKTGALCNEGEFSN